MDKKPIDPEAVLDALYEFAFDTEDSFTMPIEQVDAELREAGIDPDALQARARRILAPYLGEK